MEDRRERMQPRDDASSYGPAVVPQRLSWARLRPRLERRYHVRKIRPHGEVWTGTAVEWKTMQHLQRSMAWSVIAERKRAQRDALIPPEWRLDPSLVPEDRLDVLGVPEESGLLTGRELEIIHTPAEELVKRMLRREYTSYEVTLAFCKSASIAQQTVNCLSEILFDHALLTSAKIDATYRATGVPAGPLHGLPISLKDCFQVAGVDATIGYTAYADHPASEEDESELTRILRASGAVLFCKTNVPLAMMSGETYNHIYGYTTNPYNRLMTSGGSSGGESALLAMRGSPLGVGTDVGGSIRIPAALCGLYSLKPSLGRFPTSGSLGGLEGQEAVRNVNGPMASSLGALDLWCKAVVESWLVDDGHVKALPPVRRALERTRAALQAAGHTIIDFHVPDPHYCNDLKFELYRSAAARVLHDTLAKTGEPWPVGYDMFRTMIAPNAFLSEKALETEVQGKAEPEVEAGGEKGVTVTVTQVGTAETPQVRDLTAPATVAELWAAQSKRTRYAKHVLQTWARTSSRTGTGREMDALITPCAPGPAPKKHGYLYDNYFSLWNVLDYCATTVPCGSVELGDVEDGYEVRNEMEAKVWNEYSAEESVGCPIGIQIVGRRLHEEHLLAVTRVCDDALKTYSRE